MTGCINTAPHGHSGLTPQEGAIMALWDAGGLSMRGIARRLGIPDHRVQAIVSYYHGGADNRRFCDATSTASTALLSAIAARFPDRIGA